MRPVAAYLPAKELSFSYFALKMNNFAIIVEPKTICKLDKLKHYFFVACKYCTVLRKLHHLVFLHVKPTSLSRRSSGIGDSCHFTDFAQTWPNFLSVYITTKYM